MKTFLLIVRLASNMALALVLVALSVIIVGSGYATVRLGLWEREGLDWGTEMGEWLWIDEQPIHYRVWGSDTASTVVLIHGHAVEGSQIWMANQRALADRGLRVIAIDLKGYGHSVRDPEPNYTLDAQVSIVAQVLNELAAYDATLVGHGKGAGVVLRLAMDQPQFVERAVLVSPMMENHVPALWRQVVNLPYVGRAAIWATECGGPLWRYRLDRSFGDTAALPPDYVARTRDITRIAGSVDALRMMALSQQDDRLTELLPNARVPVLVLAGAEDWWLSEADLTLVLSDLPDGVLVYLPAAGHMVQIEQAAQVNGRIAEFALTGAR